MTIAQPINLSIITVTHNHKQYIKAYMEALLPEIKDMEAEVILIDNKSDDNSARLINQYAENNGKIKLYVNQKRQGFSANNNHGMAKARGEYILLLNPDTEVKKNSLRSLINFMEENQNVGLCGAQLIFPNGTIQPSARRFPSIGSTIARRTPLRIFLRNSASNRRHLMLDLDHYHPQSVDWLLGACLMIRREVLETVGPLDEGFFLYVEDIDWARRIHQAGWGVFYVPTATVVHHHIAVSDKHFFSYYMWLHLTSMMRYFRKYFLPPIPYLAIKDNDFTIWQSSRR
ncbi:glycosyltransferase family 2 protein [Synechocystis salina LEGE 06155]|nr:glycosyltransferase family 2 protein [Synechocystis salina LEGE 06155]